MANKYLRIALLFFACILIFLIFSIGKLDIGIYYPIEIHMRSDMEQKKSTYDRQIEDIKKDGFINPIIYSITQARLDNFIMNHDIDELNAINPHNGKGESIYTYKINNNGTIDELFLSTYPYQVINYVQFNLGQFYIDNGFIKFYKKDNIQKILDKNNISDEIKDIILLNPIYDTSNIDTMIAWIICENNNYFLCWDKCKSSVERLKRKSMKSYFQSDDYNYFTFYTDEQFCDEFKTKDGYFVDNISSDKNFDVNIYHNCAKFSIFQLLSAIGYNNMIIDDYTYILSNGTKSYKFVFSRNSAWGNAFSLDIYDDLNNKLNDYTVCHFISGEYVINDEEFNSLYSLFGKRVKIDYAKLAMYMI